jgi:SOH1
MTDSTMTDVSTLNESSNDNSTPKLDSKESIISSSSSSKTCSRDDGKVKKSTVSPQLLEVFEHGPSRFTLELEFVECLANPWYLQRK